MDELLTTHEAAKRLRVAPRTVAKWVREGRLPAFRPGRRGRFLLRASDVDAMLEQYIPDVRPMPATRSEVKACEDETERILRDAGVR